jgi:Aspartyl protease
LQSFAGQTPYQVQGDGSVNHVKFLQTDPLPLVSVRINGSQEVTFFIDTGGSEVALDSDFAQELGAPNYGSVQGTFSGGQQATVSHTRIDSLALGRWTIQNLPAVMLPLRQLSDIAGGRTINGVIGTTLFYHFLTTLDYPGGELVLRKKSAKEWRTATKGVIVPFWMASDHFMVGWGQVEDQPPSLLFVDTGLIGAGVKLGETMLKNAGITLAYDKAATGAGGGGTLTTVPYVVHNLSFGKIQEINVPGLYDGPFPWETLFGFYLAGMVGHDFFRPYALTFDFEHMQIRLKDDNVQPQD